MTNDEIKSRITELCKEAGITHDQMARLVYQARDEYLVSRRNEYQDKYLMFSFSDGIMMHEIENHTISDMVDNWSETLKGIIKQTEHKNGELGMMINSNIPSHFALFPMILH